MATIIPFVRPDAPASAPAAHGRASVLRFPAPAVAPSPAPAPATSPTLPGLDTRIEDQRKAMLAKIHIALGKLYSRLQGFNDDVYRFALQERWGVDSSAAMSIYQLDEVLHWLAELGFQSSRPVHARRNYSRNGTDALIEKVNALLAEKGRAGNGKFLGMEYAEAILKRQTRGEVESVYKATAKQLRAVIAALDKDASRKGRRRA